MSVCMCAGTETCRIEEQLKDEAQQWLSCRVVEAVVRVSRDLEPGAPASQAGLWAE